MKNTALRRCLGCAACIALIFQCLPAWAFKASGSEHTIETGGSIRNISAGIKNYDNPLLFGKDNDYDGASQTLLRLTSKGELLEQASFEIHLVQDFTYWTTPGTSALLAAAPVSSMPDRYRITSSAWNWVDQDDLRAGLDVDRLSIKVSRGNTDLTIGRQAINFSEAYFWNPLDVFLPFDPEAFDRDYKPGVDALRADITLGSFTALTFVAAFGRKLQVESRPSGLDVSAEPFTDEPWYGSALVGRISTNLHDWDLAFQAGKVYGGIQLGAGFSGEHAGMGIRGEAAYLCARGDSTSLVIDPQAPGFRRETTLVEDNLKLVMGVDYRFSSGVYFNLEYFYNGAGDDDDLETAVMRSVTGETSNLGEHLAGIELSYDFHPLLTGHAAWIHSFSDSSNLVSPTIRYSVADEAEFLCGATIGLGKRPSTEQITLGGLPVYEFPVPESEFGTYPDTFFLEFKFYF